MNDELIVAFDDCLQALASGADLEERLAAYPGLAGELRPMLQAALSAQALGGEVDVSRRAQMSSRAHLLARAAELRSASRPVARPGFLRRWSFATRALTVGLAFGLGFVLGTYGVVAASAQSLPGDALYGVKRTVENVQLLLATSPQSRERLETQFAERRVGEVQSVIRQGRTVPVEFSGRLERMAGERWTVASLSVTVSPEAQILDDPAPGVVVEIAGMAQPDGVVRALRVRVRQAPPTPSATPRPTLTRTAPPPTPVATASPVPTQVRLIEVEFTGVVESIGAGLWRIGGQTVRVNQTTELRGDPRVGRTVEVKAVRGADGTLTARRIEVKQSTSGPSASDTPRPTRTPEPDDDDDETPEPTKTPGPDDDDDDDKTPEPDDDDDKTPQPDDDGPAATLTPQLAEVDFEGRLESVSGSTWIIAGRAVHVSVGTEIKDSPKVGDEVRVRALRQPDGSLVATRIEKR